MAEPRVGFEAFDCAPGLRLEAHERVSALMFETLTARLERIEVLMERLERRLWLTVYGIVAVILAQAFQGFLEVVP
ncbi:GTA head formation protein, RCAP_rcc01685 family [Thalassococcus sp. BH17M4-6]|uniref:GTA head formation protein, RCAP_rcc01685 family n=1 Tax=Thalassococcus sp. BH17M4-6 TaxID=3413148 RepID=UPI003BC387FC